MAGEPVEGPYLEPLATSDLHALMCMTGAGAREARLCLEAARADLGLAVAIFESRVARAVMADSPPANVRDGWPPWLGKSLIHRMVAMDGVSRGHEGKSLVDTAVQLIGGMLLAVVVLWIGMG
eukprot:evm.model.scf_424.10 EVM.evm.TU.scf_424.10   scf_424:81585-81953(+)